MTVSLQARVVYPVAGPPIEHGVVTIDGERIVAVGKATGAGSLRDLGDVALLPALVNAHTHLEFSHLRQPLGQPGMRLVDWIRLVIAERGQRTASSSNSINLGLQESAAAGVLTIGDIVGPPDNSNGRALPPVPCCVCFLEVIGFSRARAASALSAVIERLDALEATRGAENQLGLSPHAPYTVSPDLLQQLASLARRRNLPVAMHVAESTDELELLSDRTGPFQELLDERSMWDVAAIPRGSRPLNYLQMLADAPRALVIHGNYLDREEQAFLAGHADRMSLVYCPRTHAYFGHSPYPLTELLTGGVRVALGTDSRASNPDLDLLSEMHCVARTFPQLSPAAVLRMGTLSGAEALGRETEVGSLTPGKRADFVALPIPAGSRGTPDEILQAVLHAKEGPSAVWTVGRECGVEAGR